MVFERAKAYYRKNYKKLIAIPAFFVLLSVALLVNHKLATGEFISLGIDLKGGVEATVVWNGTAPDVKNFESQMAAEFGEVTVREVYSYGSSQLVALVIQGPVVDAAVLKTRVLELLKPYGIQESAYSSKFVSSSVGASFLRTAIISLIAGFILMGIVIFFTFKTPPVVLTVVGSALFDVLGAAAVMNLLHIDLSPATLAALMMIVGYSVDSDILITTRVLRNKEGDAVEHAYEAMKTGLTMIVTAFAAIFALYLISNSLMLKEMAAVLMGGLFFDVINTWFTNLGALLWIREKDGRPVP